MVYFLKSKSPKIAQNRVFSGFLSSKIAPNTHCVRPIQNWIQERVRGVSGHQERPKAFPMAHMNRMVIVYKHTVQGKRL